MLSEDPEGAVELAAASDPFISDLRLKFGTYELDAATHRLLHQGEIVAASARVIDLLLLLASAHDRVVDKWEIFERLWPSASVADDSLSHTVMLARRAVGDDGTRQSVIATVRGWGFRFVAPIDHLSGSLSVSQQGDHATADADVPTIVGREIELGVLRRALAQARSGKGQALHIVGPAGIGKTALTELLRQLAGSDTPFYRGTCRSERVAGNQLQWLQLLRDIRPALRASDSRGPGEPSPVHSADSGDFAQEFSEILPDFLSSAKRGTPITDMDASTARRAMLEVLPRAIAAAARQRALVLVIEDVHRADEPTLDALRAIERECAHSQLLLVATSRNYAADKGRAEDPVAQLIPHPGVQTLRLRGLALDEARELLRRRSAIPDQRIADLVRRTGGNPAQLLRLLRHPYGSELRPSARSAEGISA